MKKILIISLMILTIILIADDYQFGLLDNPSPAYTINPKFERLNFSLKTDYKDEYIDTIVSLIEIIDLNRDDRRGWVSYYNNNCDPITLKTWTRRRYSRIKKDGILYWVYDSIDDDPYGNTVYPANSIGLDKDYFRYPYFIHTALFISPILHFVDIIDSLAKWDYVNQFYERDSLINFCKESYNAFVSSYNQTSDSTGHWFWYDNDLTGSPDCDIFYPQYPFTSDLNGRVPYNQYMVLVYVSSYLYHLTGDESYLNRLNQTCREFKNNIYYDVDKDCYLWSYSTSYNEGGGDDVSHAAFILFSLTQSAQIIDSFIYDSIDFRRFSNTVLKSMVATESQNGKFEVYPYIDGEHENNFTQVGFIDIYFRYMGLTVHVPPILELGFASSRIKRNVFLNYFSRWYNPMSSGYYLWENESNNYEKAIDVYIKSENNYFQNQPDTFQITMRGRNRPDLFSYYSNKYVMYEGDSLYLDNTPVLPYNGDTVLIDTIILKYNIIRKKDINIPVRIDTIPITIRDPMYVFNISDIGIPDSFRTVDVWVCDTNINKAVYGIEDVCVEITNSDNINMIGYTDAGGHVEFHINVLNYTRPITVTARKHGYLTQIKQITSHLYTTDLYALGSNNQDNLVYDYGVDSTYMVYSDGSNIISARSGDFGGSWHVEKIGEGREPVLAKTSTGLIAFWNQGQSFSVVKSESPWVPIDTLIWSPAVRSSEFVLDVNPETDDVYAGFLGYRYLQQEEPGNFVYVSWEDTLINSINLAVAVDDTGKDNKIPYQSPIITHYYEPDYSGYLPLLGFIDLENNFISFNWNLQTNNWGELSTQINLLDNNVVYPTVNEKLNKTYFVWIENDATSSKLLMRKMINGNLEPDVPEIDISNTVIRNPKMKDDSFYAYMIGKNIMTYPRYTARLTNIVKTTSESIYTLDYCVKKTTSVSSERYYGCFVWSEGNDSIMEILSKNIEYEEGVVNPNSFKVLTDFIETDSSTLSENVPGNPPIEKTYTEFSGLDPDLDYMIKLITSENNPNHPQMVIVDGEEMALISGHSGSVDTTEIMIPVDMITDKRINITLERVKGNPNRESSILFYEMNLEQNNVIIEASKLIPKNNKGENLNKFTTSFTYLNKKPTIQYTIPNEGNVEMKIYDLSGRIVYGMELIQKAGKYNILLPQNISSGVYFTQIMYEGNLKTLKTIKLE